MRSEPAISYEWPAPYRTVRRRLTPGIRERCVISSVFASPKAVFQTKRRTSLKKQVIRTILLPATFMLMGSMAPAFAQLPAGGLALPPYYNTFQPPPVGGIYRSEERRVGKECRSRRDWRSDVCSSDLVDGIDGAGFCAVAGRRLGASPLLQYFPAASGGRYLCRSGLRLDGQADIECPGHARRRRRRQPDVDHGRVFDYEPVQQRQFQHSSGTPKLLRSL